MCRGGGYILGYLFPTKGALAVQILRLFYHPSQSGGLVDVEGVAVQGYLSLFLSLWNHLPKSPAFRGLRILQSTPWPPRGRQSAGGVAHAASERPWRWEVLGRCLQHAQGHSSDQISISNTTDIVISTYP